MRFSALQLILSRPHSEERGYLERNIRVANTTRDDGREFIDIAARIPVRTSVLVYPFDQVNDALIALKHDAIRGATVISIF